MEFFIKLYRMLRPLTFAAITSNVQRDLARLQDLQKQDAKKITTLNKGIEKAAVDHRTSHKKALEAHQKAIATLEADFEFKTANDTTKVNALETSNKEAENYAANLELLTKGKLVTVEA